MNSRRATAPQNLHYYEQRATPLDKGESLAALVLSITPIASIAQKPVLKRPAPNVRLPSSIAARRSGCVIHGAAITRPPARMAAERSSLGIKVLPGRNYNNLELLGTHS